MQTKIGKHKEEVAASSPPRPAAAAADAAAAVGSPAGAPDDGDGGDGGSGSGTAAPSAAAPPPAAAPSSMSTVAPPLPRGASTGNAVEQERWRAEQVAARRARGRGATVSAGSSEPRAGASPDSPQKKENWWDKISGSTRS